MEGEHLSLQLFHTYACQIADAMAYLEKRRIVHRDLAIRNLLLAHIDFVSLPWYTTQYIPVGWVLTLNILYVSIRHP